MGRGSDLEVTWEFSAPLSFEYMDDVECRGGTPICFAEVLSADSLR